jgi:hypothetical protein
VSGCGGAGASADIIDTIVYRTAGTRSGGDQNGKIHVRNRWLLNLVLMVLVGAMLAVAIYRPGEKSAPPSPLLTPLTAELVNRVRVQRPHHPEIVLEKTGDQWRVSAPRKARASSFRVNELLRLASAKSESQFSIAPADLGKYGLDTPQAQVWLNDTEIRFGAAHPINPQYYVAVGDQVHLIAATHYAAASAAPMEFYSHQLLEDGLKLVELKLPGHTLALNAKGEWQVAPADTSLSSDRINTVADEWRHAQALSVAPYSGKTAHEKIQLRFAPDSPVATLELGILAHKPELILYRKDEGLEYHFPEDVGGRLLELKGE